MTGDHWGALTLGYLYTKGTNGVPQDITKGYKLYVVASESKNKTIAGTACANLGSIHLDGLMEEEDLLAAMRWYLKGADQGNPNAQYNCGIGHIYGWLGTKDIAVGKSWITKSAEQRYEPAIDYLSEELSQNAEW